MDVGPGASPRQLMREDYWEAIGGPWSLAAPHIFRDWARVVCFLMSKAMAIRNWTTASATLTLISDYQIGQLRPSHFELPEYPEKKHMIVHEFRFWF